MSVIRRLRGAIGMAGIWAAVAIPLGLLSTVLRWALNGEIYDFTDLEALSWQVAVWGATGVISGLVFAGALAVSERGLDASRVSRWRAALDGALAGGLGYFGGFLAITGPSLRGDLIALLEGLAPAASVSALIGGGLAIGLRYVAATTSRRAPEGESENPPTAALNPSRDHATDVWDVRARARARTR
jgi:hypothetical protein